MVFRYQANNFLVFVGPYENLCVARGRQSRHWSVYNHAVSILKTI